ncbi:MAG: hypothetical protein VX722_05635 [Pseudomonadota bacterium]|nr:hypothetical protein [Pseudomonadota bacterium]MEC7938749.1 hypothetical protein [Pseudomonadota bacterium]
MLNLLNRSNLTAVSFVRKVLVLFVISQATNAQDNNSNIEQYLEEIDRIEATEGAYSAALSDLLMSLGMSYQEKVDYENANLAFQRGMQLEKINYGLFSLGQTPYLQEIANTHRLLGDWEQSQKAIDQFYIVNEKNFGEKDQRMLPIIESMLDWHAESYNLRDPRDSFPSLSAMERLAAKMHVILDDSADLGDPSTPEKYLRIGKIQYMLARHIKDFGLPQESGMSITTDRYATERNSPLTSHNYYSRGSAALQKVVKSVMEQKPPILLDQIEAIANLGDWYLIFGQSGSATKAYALADELISSTPESEEIRAKIFGAGKLINFDNPNNKMSSDQNMNLNLVNVSMTISRSGSALDIIVKNEDKVLTDDEELALRKYFKKRRFRPSFSEGKTRSMNIVLPYYLPKIEA